MANTTFARSDALTVEHWAQMLTYDIVYRTPISPLIGTDENSARFSSSAFAQGRSNVRSQGFSL